MKTQLRLQSLVKKKVHTNKDQIIYKRNRSQHIPKNDKMKKVIKNAFGSMVYSLLRSHILTSVKWLTWLHSTGNRDGTNLFQRESRSVYLKSATYETSLNKQCYWGIQGIQNSSWITIFIKRSIIIIACSNEWTPSSSTKICPSMILNETKQMK